MEPEASPPLLLSSGSFFRKPLREAFEHTRRAGYRGVEVMVTSDPDTQDPERLRALAAEFDLRVMALHAPFLLLTRRVWSTDPVQKIRTATEVAGAAGIPLVVVHPPYRWQVRYRRFVERTLPTHAARAGVTVAVENMFPVKVRGDRGLRFHHNQDFDDLDHFTHLVLDTSHLAVAGFDLLEAYRRYQTKVVHFHLSNNAGKGWDSHLPLDEGVLPVTDLLDALAGDRFAGTIALELDLRKYVDHPDTLHEVLVRNRELCEQRLEVRT